MNYLNSAEFLGDLYAFVRESNAIESIHRDPTAEEISATLDFIKLPEIRIADVENLVHIYTNGARLRRTFNDNVIVGNHIPPRGGPEIVSELAMILKDVNNREHPYRIHIRYETLHPFQDGNGRSGRAIWAWQMMRDYLNPEFRGWKPGIKLRFLHAFYYQTLSDTR